MIILIVSVGVDKDGPGQRVSWKLPPAHSFSPFLTRAAVAVPVHFLSNPDCFCPCHADTPCTGDKCVREHLEGPLLIWLEWLAVLQFSVTFLQHYVVHSFHLDLFEIQPQDTVYVGSSSALKLDPVGDVPHPHGVVGTEDDLLSEGLHPMLEIPGGSQDISLHHLVLALVHMVFEILLPGLRYFPLVLCHFHRHIFFALRIHIIMNLAAHFFQLRCEVGAPPLIPSSEGEEDLEGADIFQLCYHLVFDSLPVLGSPFDLFEHSAGVLQLITDLSPWSHSSFALHPSEVSVFSESFSLHHRHGTEEVARCPGESVVDVEEPLLEVLLSG